MHDESKNNINKNHHRCWICGAEADSAEHRIKKSDLVRAYGRGPYRGDTAPLHFHGNNQSVVQGSNARTAKYDRSLCHRCNTTFTQPFDQAYNLFMEWIMANERQVLQKRFVNFVDVYGEQFEVCQRNLYKYFAKSFGCRLVDAGYEVPTDVIELLRLTYFQTALLITLAVNEDILILPSVDRDGFIGKGDLCALAERSDPTRVTGYTWNEHISWFTVCYWYGCPPDGDFWSTWIANSQHVYLGSYQPLTPEMRKEAAQKARARVATLGSSKNNT